MALARTPARGMDHASHGESFQDLPRRPRGASVNVLDGDIEVAG